MTSKGTGTTSVWFIKVYCGKGEKFMPPEGLCFYTQQAVEKALKVVALMPDLFRKPTLSLINNRIDMVGVNIVPVYFYT